jgi:hypothetical protein
MEVGCADAVAGSSVLTSSAAKTLMQLKNPREIKTSRIRIAMFFTLLRVSAIAVLVVVDDIDAAGKGIHSCDFYSARHNATAHTYY